MPGKEMVIARRKGQDWYVGGINGESTSKNWPLTFSFLPENTSYNAALIMDGEEKRAFSVEQAKVTSGESRELTMLPEGGFAIRLTPSAD
jgi:hypothetical protein